MVNAATIASSSDLRDMTNSLQVRDKCLAAGGRSLTMRLCLPGPPCRETPTMRLPLSLCLLLFAPAGFAAAQPADLFGRGEAIELSGAIPANERGITCLTPDEQGRVYGGTSGRAAHLF